MKLLIFCLALRKTALENPEVGRGMKKDNGNRADRVSFQGAFDAHAADNLPMVQIFGPQSFTVMPSEEITNSSGTFMMEKRFATGPADSIIGPR